MGAHRRLWPRDGIALVGRLSCSAECRGIGVLDRLNLAGYTDPGSESARADELTQATFGRLAPDILVLYTAPDGQTVDDIGPQVVAQLAAVDRGARAADRVVLDLESTRCGRHWSLPTGPWRSRW